MRGEGREGGKGKGKGGDDLLVLDDNLGHALTHPVAFFLPCF